MNSIICPNHRDGISTPIKKAQTVTKGLGEILSKDYNATAQKYHDKNRRESIGKELINDWFSCLEFFKEREAYHQESASWYFSYSREMERKAEQQISLAELAHANYSHYLDLLSMAILKSGVCHAG